MPFGGFLGRGFKILREVAKIKWSVFISKGRKKGCPGCTGHFPPPPLS